MKPFLGGKFMPYSSSYIDEILGSTLQNDIVDDISNHDDFGESCVDVGVASVKVSTSVQNSIFQIHGYGARLIAVTNKQVFYLSGFCNITLIKGKLSVNGYSLKQGVKVRIDNPIWQPAQRLFGTISSSNKPKSIKKALQSACPTLNASDLASFCDLAAIDTNHCCFIIEEIPRVDQHWLIAAEDQSLYASQKSISSRFMSMKSSNNSSKSQKFGHSTSSGSVASVECASSSAVVAYDSCILGSLEYMTALGLELTNLPASWANGVDTINTIANARDPLRVVICGAKGVGKSSCLRYTVNSLLSKMSVDQVCVIDCDLGQPELTVPGMISLHVVNKPLLGATHLNLLDRKAELSFYIGDITSRHEPELLINCLRALIARYYELVEESNTKHSNNTKSEKIISGLGGNNFNALFMVDDTVNSNGEENITDDSKPAKILPLVVNTDGFVRYMGAEVLVAILSCVAPTNVLHISTEKDRALPALDRLPSETPCTVSTLEPGRLTSAKVAAVDLRALRLISYFQGNNDLLRSKVRAPLINLSLKIATTNTNNLAVSSANSSNSANNELTSAGSGIVSSGRGIYIRNAAIVDVDGHIALSLLNSHQLIVPFVNTVIHSNTADIPVSQLLASLNASIVGLAVLPNEDRSSATTDTDTVPLITTKHKLAIDNNTGSSSTSMFELECAVGGGSTAGHCIGLGIIRAIDIQRQYFVITTPVDPSLLCPNESSEYSDHYSHINKGSRAFTRTKIVLLRSTAAQQLPNALIFAPGLPHYPYMSSESAGEGSAKMKARNNVKRRSQHNK